MSILEKLSEERIFDIRISEDNKTAIISEGCDGWFNEALTKSELLQLTRELSVIAFKMED